MSKPFIIRTELTNAEEATLIAFRKSRGSLGEV
jgi:hypothetical protein